MCNPPPEMAARIASPASAPAPRLRRLSWLALAFWATLPAAAGAVPESPAEARDPMDPRRFVELTREFIDRQAPADLERALSTQPESALQALLSLGRGLSLAEPPLLQRLQAWLAECARERARNLTRRGPPWSDEELETLLILLLVDPPRFAADAEFRERVVPVIERALPQETAPEIRRRLLYTLNRVRNFHFRYAERVQLAWGVLARSSQPLRVSLDLDALLPVGVERPIEASIYHLSSTFFTPRAAADLLESVHGHAPQRRLLVLADSAMGQALEPLTHELPLDLVETWGRPFSPWVRDVLTFRRHVDGHLVAVLRPDTQVGREDDAHMGQVLLQQLPEDLFDRWRPRWAASSIPFHNGQILHTPDAIWVSVHALRAQLRRLGAQGSADDPAGGEPQPLESIRQAGRELEALFGQPLHFVHELAKEEALGGAFDLDSLLTLLPVSGGKTTALVADLDRGVELLRGMGARDLSRLAEIYGLGSSGSELQQRLLMAQDDGASLRLKRFLDDIARTLRTDGLTVERLPVLRVPTALLRRPLQHDDFLLSWNNVTLETRGGERFAEGFSSGIERGDRIAAAAFERAGYRMVWLPPLAASVVRNGGYRCASNHVRAPRPG